MSKHTKGQSTVEYAVTVAVVIGALLAMQGYMKRGVMGRARTATDQIGEQFTPKHYTANYSTHSLGTRKETTSDDGSSTSAIEGSDSETQTRKGLAGGETGDEHITQSLSDEKLF